MVEPSIVNTATVSSPTDPDANNNTVVLTRRSRLRDQFDTNARASSAYRVGMDEARAVIERLNRIEALEREGAHPPALLAELRELVREAEAWVRAEGKPERAAAAVERCKEALDRQILAV